MRTLSNLRNECLRDEIATIIQTGHIEKKTSEQVADAIMSHLEKPLPGTEANAEGGL